MSVFEDPEFWVGVTFALFIGLLLYYKVPRLIAKALDDRADAIRKELDEARRLRTEAQQLLADYQRKAREADQEAAAIVEQARREAEVLATDTRTRLKETLDRRTKLLEERISRAEAQALGEVRAAAVDAAIATAERLLKAKISPDVGSSLADQSIRDLKGKLN